MGGENGCGSNSIGEIQVESRFRNRGRALDSLYSLTLDEVQNHLGELGKPLGSMNLDELVRTVWTAEVSGDERGCVAHEHSGCILSVDLSKKTVDEVWQDIQVGQKSSIDDGEVAVLGEMILEDFLVKAGVVSESALGRKKLGSDCGGTDPMGVPWQWMDYQVPSIDSRQQQQGVVPVQLHVSLAGNPLVEGGEFPETQITRSSSPQCALSDTQMPARKRIAPLDIAEKSVERRQKRMIKNRESAARSRARRQAYTQELENKISRLEDEIEKLKRQKELEKALRAIPLPEPKYQMRRTASTPLMTTQLLELVGLGGRRDEEDLVLPTPHEHP